MRVLTVAAHRAVATLALAATLAGCALVAPRPAPDPARLRIADLLLIGFTGTQVAGNEEVRRLVCDVKVGGLLLFERYTSGQPRNMVSQEQVATLTRDLQALAMRCAGRPLFIAADAEGGRVMRLSLASATRPPGRRRSWASATIPPSPAPRRGAWARCCARPASTGTWPRWWTWR